MADSKSILILMGGNAEKFDLQQSIHWSSATLERCNLVYTNGHNNDQQNYIVHVVQMPEELLTCSAGAAQDRVGSFFVGAEPFNPHEHQTLANTCPSKALEQLDIKVYNADGTLATITNPFHLKLKIKKHVP